MPNFNPSMLQPHQMQQQTSQQQHQDNHQPMPSFSEQSHLWSQMQHLQNQFRPNNGADVNSPQIGQQASLVTLAIFQATSFPLGVPQMSAGPSGGPSQQPPFHDPSSQRQPVGFPNLVNGGGLQAPLSQNSMQARNAMMQAITNNQNHNRQLELIGMAANQQNQNGPMSFPSRLNAQQQPQQQQQQQQQPQSVNPPGQGDIFAPAMGANDALRRASPANPPTQMGGRPHQFTMAPNGMMRSQLPPELQSRIMSLRTVIGSGENNIRNLQNNRAGMSDVTYYAQLKTQQNEVAKAKEMLGRVIQLASNNNMCVCRVSCFPIQHNMNLANQQSHQPSQPQWMQPASQASSFGNGQASHQPQQSNLQPSPSQHHSQPPPQSHNIPQMIPPNRSVSTSQHLPSQTPLGGIPFNMNTVTGGGQSGIPNGISNSFGPAHPPPLEKTRFEAAYMNYLTSKGLNRDVRTVATIENRPVDIHVLHTHVMQEGDLWAAIAARLGFVQFPGNDTEPAKSGPGTAHQLEQIYKDHLAHFDMVYVTTVLESRRKQQVSMAAQQLANPNPAKSVNGPQMQMVMAYADLSPAELRAKGVQEHIITFIENHRAHIQRTAAEQNLFRGNLRGASMNQPVQPPSEGITAAANNRQFTATPSQSPAGPSNPLGHVATSPPHFIPNPALQNGTTDGGMMEHRPHLPNNTIIPQFMRGNQEQLSRISSMLSQVKQDFLANRMAALGSVRVLPEERMAYNAVVEQLHRATGELENKLPMLYLFANGKNDVWVKRLAVIVVTVQQQRSFLTSNNPRFIVNLDNLRLMLSEVQKGHERFNAMVQTIMAQQQQQQHQQQHQQQPPPPPPGGTVVNGPPASNMSRPPVSQQPNAIHHSQQKKPIQPVSSSPAGVAAASPTPPPVPAASTPTPNASTPSATNSINIASSPRSPKVKAPNKPVKTTKRKISKASSTPTIEPAQPPNPMPTNGVKRPREEETPALSSTPSGASGSGAAVTPPSGPSAANEPSPPKKAKTEWEGPPNDALKKREETVENIRTEEDASQFLEQMTELIKMAGEGQESTLSSDISETLDMILKGYSAAPDGVDGTSTSSSVGEGSSTGGHEPTPSIPSADEFVEFFDFSLFETEANDDEGSKAPTPDLVSSSSTNPSPESGSEADPAHHALTFSDFKTDEPSDPLRLGTFKEVDGGESAYYQSTEWKWDGPMTTLDQPWAIFTSSS
ncbi:uncharacterized protein EV420DRAFT_1257420 [Desarmillaria tabescens]|uniref:ARID domain-containing protein n=1 Tax=Armillaria tabescens TaxID=1929756 RepID=A0AA39U8Z7_ARMTA|nr:uncharacterized protein EV420DRAFT_1257420 [Desarmillaria tabescens]KAK0470025.1 hypothetical protein EV420DRAFT_1257420 [Desarmillaria tabescens]